MRMWRALVLGTAVTAMTSAAFAQTQPSLAGPGNVPAVPGAPSVGGMGMAGNQNPFWDGGLPASQLNQVPVARMQAVAARWAYYTARDRLNDGVLFKRVALETSGDYRDAVAAEAKAYRDYSVARTKALSNFNTDPNYSATTTVVTSYDRQIELERGKDYRDRDADKLMALARLKLDATLPNRKLEGDALGRDSDFQNARQAAITASARVLDLRRKFDADVRGDANLAQIRYDMDQLRIARLASGAYLDASLDVARIALRYAYDYRFQGRYYPGNYYSGYGAGGYGGGYGSPFLR